jgi:hypothetical protein
MQSCEAVSASTQHEAEAMPVKRMYIEESEDEVRKVAVDGLCGGNFGLDGTGETLINISFLLCRCPSASNLARSAKKRFAAAR